MKYISQIEEDIIFNDTGNLEEVIGTLQTILEHLNALMYQLYKQKDLN